MKKIKFIMRKTIYVIKRVIPAIIAEFNRKDGYIFRTNFSKEDKPAYVKALEKMGVDFRIDNSATGIHGRPVRGCYALYVKGSYEFSKFYKLYGKYKSACRGK